VNVLNVGDPVIKVVATEHDKTGDCILYHLEVEAPNGNKHLLKKRFSDILRDLHHGIGRPLGLAGPSRHILDSLFEGTNNEFVTKRAKEIELYIRLLIKTPGVVNQLAFINFFQLFSLEDKETLQRRETREKARIKAVKLGAQWEAQEPDDQLSPRPDSRPQPPVRKESNAPARKESNAPARKESNVQPRREPAIPQSPEKTRAQNQNPDIPNLSIPKDTQGTHTQKVTFQTPEKEPQAHTAITTPLNEESSSPRQPELPTKSPRSPEQKSPREHSELGSSPPSGSPRMVTGETPETKRKGSINTPNRNRLTSAPGTLTAPTWGM